MAEEEPLIRSRSKDDLELRNPNISFSEKWNRHVSQKKANGVIRHASSTNRWAPRGYYFVCLGGTAWIMAGSIPYYYGDNFAWMLFMEVFTIYVFVQVMTNYFLTKSTDSSYKPGIFDSIQIYPNENRPILLNPATSPISASNNECQIPPVSDSLEQERPSSSSSSSSSSPGKSYQVLVATSVSGNDVERKSFPYWSWVPCISCARSRPPRCHHCAICKQCVLKRDHHCYFTKVCIGVNNHRYYIYFLFWCVLLTWLGSFQLVPYLYDEVLKPSPHSYWNLLIPFNLYTTATGELTVMHLHLIFVVWGVVFLTFVSSGMFGNSVYLIFRGLTSFESSHGIKVLDTRNPSDRLRSVLGRNWAIDLLIPGLVLRRLVLPCLPDYLRTSEPLENAVEWPYIKTA